MRPYLTVLPLEMLPVSDVRWLWPHYLAEGRIAILEGEPGVGKSFVAINVAARLSRGGPPTG